MPWNDRTEIWGGVECSHVLINGMVRDQVQETGHRSRLSDLDLIAGLGLKTLRYPLLWAKIAARSPPDFAWEDERLARLTALGIEPIAGFLHHGSGPKGMDPLHSDFAAALADHAEAVALRYPWIRRFTPINEPVTTARFAYLYGHWHPHARDEATFLRAVVASALATAAAMGRIRRHIPNAQLVQTEDVGRIFSPPALAYQADYENERRFLGFDLLTGRVAPGHPFHRRLLDAGVPARDLDRLVAEPCPPQIIGVDQYLTSDRYLDPVLDHHPPALHGGNGRDAYADIAAAHVPDLHHALGFLPRLREVHARYGLPVALTEVHNGAPPEGQLRWLAEAWKAAQDARAEGIRVQAITSWSLFGCIDWDSLLCERRGHYEPGAFDIRCDPPRRTAVGEAVAMLARRGTFDHPVLNQPDWWRPPVKPEPALLSVEGPRDLVRQFLDCCSHRRIDGCAFDGVVPHMARVIICRNAPDLMLQGQTPDGELIVEHRVEPHACFNASSHAFLDVLVESTGRW